MGLIFAVPGHIEAIRAGTKTQTRRPAKPGDEYRGWMPGDLSHGQLPRVMRNERLIWRVGDFYAIQPGRGQRGVGFIQLVGIRNERVGTLTEREAQAEGGYTQAEYEALWAKLYGTKYEYRWVLTFRYVVHTFNAAEGR